MAWPQDRVSPKHGPATSGRGVATSGEGGAASGGAAGGRGRQASDEEVAHQLKLDSERQDREARRLRINANKDYDESQELSRKIGILQGSVSREGTKEAGYAEVLAVDKASVKRDHELITKATKLQMELGRRRAEERKAAAELAKARAVAALDIKRKVRDATHAEQQESRAQRLLKEADRDANEAVSWLTEAHRLKLNSETEVQTSGGSQDAADDFQEAKRKEGESRRATSQALNTRSKSRLAEELVTVLRGMVSKDVTRLARDKRTVKGAERRAKRVLTRVESDEREATRHPLSALQTRLGADTAAEAREAGLWRAAKARGAKLANEAEGDQDKSMRLMHAEHRLQLESAKHLSQSTVDIQKEESTV